MRRLNLDYAPQSAWANRPGLFVLLVAVFVAATMPALYVHYADENEARQARWKQLQRSAKYLNGHASTGSQETPEVQAEIRRANEITAQLDLPWNQLFQALEASSDETVALLGIQPDVPKRMVSIAAEARDVGSAVAYVKRLGSDAVLSGAHIINHQVQDQDPEQPMRFAVQAIWRERLREPGK